MRLKTKSAKIELLRGVALFSACSEKELGLVASIADEVSVDEGHVLAREGAGGHEFFVIASGEATVTRGGREVAVLRQGAFFGEMSLLDGGPRSATVTARAPMHLLVVDSRSFRSLMRQVPSVTQKILTEVVRRLRAASESSTQ